MKGLFLTLIVACTTAFTYTQKVVEPAAAETVKWYTWEEAIEANKKNPKKMMIDIYTSWCGLCKVMDRKTFSDPEVAKKLNEEFYAIKLNAEQKDEIIFNEHTFQYVKQGRKGVHMLAYSLLDGQLSYPSIVFMDETVKRIMISKGFKNAPDFMKELQYTSGGHYNELTFDQFKASSGKK
ncbi:MAG: DUF255 domain-containing protein [Bacteroidota bacterium]